MMTGSLLEEDCIPPPDIHPESVIAPSSPSINSDAVMGGFGSPSRHSSLAAGRLNPTTSDRKFDYTGRASSFLADSKNEDPIFSPFHSQRRLI